MTQKSDTAIAKLFGWLAASFAGLWLIGAVLSCVLTAGMIGGIGYAIYWGLSLAERSVEAQESDRPQVEIEPEALTDRP